MSKPLLEKFSILILIIIVIIGFVLINLGFHKPHMFTFDEDVYERLGSQLKENPLNYDPRLVKVKIQKYFPSEHNIPAYMDEPLFKHPPFFPWLLSLSSFVNLTPYSYMPAIRVPIFLGILNIAMIFFFAKRLYDYRVGLLAAFFLAIDPIHWLCSEKIWMETTLTLFMFLALFLFFLGWKQNRYLLLSGLFCGLAMLTKYTGIITPISIFLFALVYKEELLFKKNFWFIFVIALAVFSPWLFWNYQVYGTNFLNKMLNVQTDGKAFSVLYTYSVPIILLTLIIVLLSVLRLINHKFAPSIRENTNTFFKVTVIKFIIPTVIIAGFITMFLYPSFRLAFKNMWSYNHLPSSGWKWLMFAKAPWNFYFSRLLELSPIYLFSFLAMILFSFKNNQNDSLLIFSAFLMMPLIIFWGYYESRYVLPIVPIFLILASRLQIWIWDRLKVKTKSLKIKISRFVFLGMVGYSIVKTLIVSIHLALPNAIGIF